jgi:hypothetical protein
MIKLTSKERDALDLLQDCKFKHLMLSYKYKRVLEDLLEKGYIIKKKWVYKLNLEGK